MGHIKACRLVAPPAAARSVACAVESLEPRRLLSAAARTVEDGDLLGPGQIIVHASGTSANPAFAAANAADGSNAAFVFDDGAGDQRLSISNVDGAMAVDALVFFDAPSYADRAASSVTVYYSPVQQVSLTQASYRRLGSFTLPTRDLAGTGQADAYPTPTNPADHPRATDPGADPAATIGWADLTALNIPAGTRSVLLDFGANPAGLGFAFSEIQAFGSASPRRAADPTMLGWGLNVYQRINESLRAPGTDLYAETAHLDGARSGGNGGFAFVWPHSTQFRVLDALAAIDPAAYRPALRAFADELHARYWSSGSSRGGYRAGVGAGTTRFYDDNAHVAVAQAEAYHLTGDPVYLARAVQTYRFVLTGEDDAGGGGIYFHEHDGTVKETVSTLQGARAALMLYQITGQGQYLADAQRLYAWTATHTQESTGVFLERYYLTGPRAGAAGDFALVNAAGMGISCNLLFYATTGDAAYLREAQRIGQASLGRYVNSSNGAINDEGFWAFELVDALNDLYRHDRNPAWGTAVKRAVAWLRANREDPNGHYGRFWGRGGTQGGTVLTSWHLNDQAAVARAYLYTAANAAAGSAVLGRWVFYNRSAFDGNNPAPNSADDAAIAADKRALLPGQAATFANYTGYSRGLNGVMIDVAGLPPGVTPTANDLAVRRGNSDAVATWTGAAGPIVTVRGGAGVNGSDRVTLLWPDGSVRNTWLQVTLKANATTGLPAPDVFYFGNAVGETGNAAANATVTAADEIGARAHQRSLLNPAPVTDRWDLNRDRRVGPADQLIARTGKTTTANDLNLINVPASLAALRPQPARPDVTFGAATTATASLRPVGDRRPGEEDDREARQLEVG